MRLTLIEKKRPPVLGDNSRYPITINIESNYDVIDYVGGRYSKYQPDWRPLFKVP